MNNRIRCYAHIINICSSHIIASVTSTTNHYLSNLEVPLDSNFVTCNDSDDRPDNDNSNDGSDDDNSDNSSDDEDFDNGSGNNDSDDELDDVDVNLDCVVAKLELAKGYDIKGDRKLRRLLKGIQRDPLNRA